MFFLLDQKEPKNQENPIGLYKGNAPSADFLPPRAGNKFLIGKRRQDEKLPLG
jgi:hypothetical protein